MPKFIKIAFRGDLAWVPVVTLVLFGMIAGIACFSDLYDGYRHHAFWDVARWGLQGVVFAVIESWFIAGKMKKDGTAEEEEFDKHDLDLYD